MRTPSPSTTASGKTLCYTVAKCQLSPASVLSNENKTSKKTTKQEDNASSAFRTPHAPIRDSSDDEDTSELGSSSVVKTRIRQDSVPSWEGECSQGSLRKKLLNEFSMCASPSPGIDTLAEANECRHFTCVMFVLLTCGMSLLTLMVSWK